MTSKTIWCTTTAVGEEPTPLFLGREDGTIEKYISAKDADLGQPSLVLRGHTKAVTALFAPSADELYSCSLDGTVRRWNASVEGNSERTARTVQLTHFHTGLRCLVQHNNRFYAGGEDGSLNVVDGEKQSTWDGHTDVLSCIAAPEGELLVTGGYDHHVRVWNTTTGRCICILQGHQNQVKGLAVVDSGENAEGEPTSVILSFSRDGVMKAWRMPNPQDPSEDPLLVLTEAAADDDEPRREAAVSFQEPRGDEEEGQEGDDGARPPSALADAAHRASDVGAKSALKPKEKQFVRRQAALGTIELPQAPHVVCYHPEEEEGTRPLLLVGATDGYVLGIDASAFAKAITSFAATNEAKVRKEVKSTQTTLRKSVALTKKNCRKAILGERKRLLRLAKRALKEKKAAEREVRRQALEEKRAAAAAARAEAAEEDEGDEEQPEEEEETPEEEQPEDEEEGEEPQGEDDSAQLALLTDEQRAELAAFTAAEEGARDEKIATLEKAVAQHLAQVRPLALATYDRRREDFYRLKGTTYTKLGHDAVLTVVQVGEKLYGSQGSHIVPGKIAMGTTSL